MKGRINKNGWLRIERGGKMQLQYCPYVTKDFVVDDTTYPCGDWCPLFGEPKTVKLDTLYQSDMKKQTALFICHDKCLVFDEFTDEREQKC